MDGEHWARVSKRGITERKRAKIENPYLNAQYEFTYLISRKSFKRVGGRVVRWPWVIFQSRGVLQFG